MFKILMLAVVLPVFLAGLVTMLEYMENQSQKEKEELESINE